MDTGSIGAGLAALGFWLFIAAVVIAGIWDGARKRESNHETIRRLVESGTPLDEKLINQITGVNENLDRDLRFGGTLMLWISPGLAVLGIFLSFINPKALMPLLGVAVLVGFIGFGLIYCANMYMKWREQDQQEE